MSDFMAMMGMSNTFSNSITSTLFFPEWTTKTPAAYFGTLLFLFFLAILNRFFGAWRSQLSRVWADEAARARLEQLRVRHRKLRKQRLHLVRQSENRKTDNPGISSERKDRDDDWDTETQPLSPPLTKDEDELDDELGLSAKEIALEKYASSSSISPKWTAVFGGRWKAGNPWRWRIDAPRAVLEFSRAFIGYILMLAVMTFNVGFFFAVLGGILFGELFLGRYTSGTGWEEGGCHDG